ncbi:MAG: hypothetical protein ACRDT8_00080 [Micromonosporaceae bacterium]
MSGRTIADSVSHGVMTTVREAVEASGKPVQHADVVKATGFPDQMTYIALQRLAGAGDIIASFENGREGMPLGTYYMTPAKCCDEHAEGVAQ